MTLIINWLILSAAVGLSAYLLPGITVAGLWVAVIAALAIGIINAILKPILTVLTLPINVLTLGLFTLVINAGLIMLAAQLVDGFAVQNFWWALIFSLILSVITSVLAEVLK